MSQKEIWKHHVLVNGGFGISVPEGIVRAVAWQRDSVFAWIEHEIGSTNNTMSLCAIGTGQPFDSEGWEFVGSAVSDELVFHVYKQGDIMTKIKVEIRKTGSHHAERYGVFVDGIEVDYGDTFEEAAKIKKALEAKQKEATR